MEYFGENPKTTQPSMFFPTFGRLIKAYKVRMCDEGFTFVFITNVAFQLDFISL